jgi:hypothetical protein
LDPVCRQLTGHRQRKNGANYNAYSYDVIIHDAGSSFITPCMGSNVKSQCRV